MAELETQTTFREAPGNVGPKKDFPSAMRDVAGDAYMLLSLKSAPTSPSHGGTVSDFIVTSDGKTELQNAMAKLEAKGFEYIIREKRTVIGRDSSNGKVDVNMGMSSFISRRHMEIYFEEPNSFFMICRGKNGVFVDGVFQRKGAPPCKLSQSCLFRFPSTNIRLEFQSLMVDRNANLTTEVGEDLDKSLKNNDKQPNTGKNISNDEHEQSPNASPTATISAANSCPSSPRSANRARFEANIANKSQDDFKKAVVYAASNMTKEPIIGQEAVDLIKPALPTNVIDPTALPITPVQPKKKKPRSESGKSAYRPSPNTGETSGIPTPFFIEPTDDASKPPYSYAQLIVQAIASSPDQQLTLNDIYSWITKTYPFYRTADKGWQNSIRHNLSLNRYFLKIARCQSEPGKGSFWKIDPACIDKLTEQSFKKRRQRPNCGSEASPRLTPNHPREHHQHNPNLNVDFSSETERAAASIGGQEVYESEIISTDYGIPAPTALGPSTFIVSNPFGTNQISQSQGQQPHVQNTPTAIAHPPGATVKLLVDPKIHQLNPNQPRLHQVAFSNGTAIFLDPTNLPPGARIARIEHTGTPGHITVPGSTGVPTTISLTSLPRVSETAPALKAATVTVAASLPSASLPPGTVSLSVSQPSISVVVQDPSSRSQAGPQSDVNRIVIDSVGKVITLPIKQETITRTAVVSQMPVHTIAPPIPVHTIAPPLPVSTQPTNPIDILTNVALMSDPNVKVEIIKPPAGTTVTLPILKNEIKDESNSTVVGGVKRSLDEDKATAAEDNNSATTEKQLKTE